MQSLRKNILRYASNGVEAVREQIYHIRPSISTGETVCSYPLSLHLVYY